MNSVVKPIASWRARSLRSETNLGERARLTAGTAVSPTRCRCGTHLPAGSLCFGFSEVPEVVRSFLSSQAFCSVRCAQAYLLEALEVFEAARATPAVGDVDEAVETLRGLYQGTGPGSR